jgi:hypothetical protein
LQLAGVLCFLLWFMFGNRTPSSLFFAGNAFAVPLVLGLVSWISAWLIWRESKHVEASKRWVSTWTASAPALYLPLAYGLMWWLLTWHSETERFALRPEGLGLPYLPALHLGLVLATSTLWAAVAAWRAWLQAGRLTALTLLGFWACYLGSFDAAPAFLASAHGGWLLWPLALVWHFALLRLQDKWLPLQWLKIWHVTGFWFFLGLLANESKTLMDMYLLGTPDRAGGQAGMAAGSSWSWLAGMFIPAIVLAAVRSSWLNRRWPLSQWRDVYRTVACAPVALYLWAWLVLSNIMSAGHAHPLPYVPLLNPLELGHWLVLTALVMWGRDQLALKPYWKPLAAASALLLISGMVVRACYHYAGAQWGWEGIMQSTVTQSALSVTWAVCAVATMSLSNRLRSRAVWAAGAALMGVVVLKLFVVDLSDNGGIHRIVSFIGVGILLLLVGYFAPVPPKQADKNS